ncbi:MAG: RNA polymerase sigma factor [bacterium]|nr:RNA polymerase sigma factor [bacterium]
MGESVTELTAAVASGDTEAFARFYRGRFDEMYGVARRTTGRDESFCLDVVQDALMRVIRSMKPMDTETHLRAWLRAVVSSCAYDRLRSEARRRRWEQAAAELRPVESPDDGLEERLAWLQDELEHLDAPQARLMMMRYRLGWTLQRIGDAVGLKPGAVDGRVGRVLAALRRRAKESFDE